MGRNVTDDDFLMLLNAHQEGVEFRLPECGEAGAWSLVFNTANEDQTTNESLANVHEKFGLEAFSFVLLSRPQSPRSP
jgi:isoamylase